MYAGPLRDEPIAIELHNTLYASGGAARDGLADEAPAWLEDLATRLPAGGDGPGPTVHELVGLREAVRAALQEAMAGTPHDPGVLDVINRASRRAPRSPVAVARDDGDPVAATHWHGASRADVVIGAFAADAIDLLTGPRRHQLQTCGAPGCVLMFLKTDPRREWCCNACGNRARQARHYRRLRGPS